MSRNVIFAKILTSLLLVPSTHAVAQQFGYEAVQNVKNLQEKKEEEGARLQREREEEGRVAAGNKFKEYEGKQFSDVGTVDVYAKTMRLFSDMWYVQIKLTKDPELAVYCMIANNEDDPRLAEIKRKFPENTRVRMTGKMEEWVTSNKTMRLNNFCSVSRE